MIHINNFIDKIKFFESRNSKDFIIPLSEAKNIHADITKLLLVLQETRNNTNTNDNIPPNNYKIKGKDW